MAYPLQVIPYIQKRFNRLIFSPINNTDFMILISVILLELGMF